MRLWEVQWCKDTYDKQTYVVYSKYSLLDLIDGAYYVRF